ncbi:hypothetical protein F8388_004524 [Cannabis sativa]|uniref:NADH:ubiquinone oxidoreductase 30kDa subunit domain-containing protein n=1 Tax=Cannabis sativa TaxID=3483 RepID=A0A7J6ENJ9_CANSA|nr:hypothetical protein F8388_004524 [Cannabis sativa]
MQCRLSVWLIKHGLVHRSLGFDYQGIETLQIKPEDWHSIAVILYVSGYNYLRSQCAYDVAPGGLLASVYHLTRIEYAIDSADFQERESYDMLGIYYDNHPHLKHPLLGMNRVNRMKLNEFIMPIETSPEKWLIIPG